MGKINIDKERCKGCELCIKFCPHSLIVIKKNLNNSGFYVAEFLDKDSKCTGCTFCALVCPEIAIEVYR